ncbi:MAG: hypothetical protein M1828_007007 [Chrysothrix sp. TS-e1954]|nr:MAG: hypothetical protein M1828_007007 [Chrysothrix sp. TS-e1954]
MFTVEARLSSSSAQNVAVYWGQNSYGATSGPFSQQRLAVYCANSALDVIPLAFSTAIHDEGMKPKINFANADNNCTLFPGSQLLNCSQLGYTYAKTILLSIGGATYAEGGFASPEDATNGADVIWRTFGPDRIDNTDPRPFGSSAVDGFDMDFEAAVINMGPFANRLRSLMMEDAALSGKQWYLTAAPQCPYPDFAENEMLNGSVFFDVVWVQFYNNYCGLQSFQKGATRQASFNFDVWDSWATNVSKNPDVKVMLGVPGSATAAGSGYTSLSELTPIMDYCKRFRSFGGVMVWDASQAFQNGNFLVGIKGSLGES